MDDLEKDFREKVEAFLKAVKEVRATVTITSTLRPKERAYLMHWAWMITNKDQDPQKAPTMDGVAIKWWHGAEVASKKAAQAMVDAYGIKNLKVAPALAARHTEGKGIDMKINWKGTLKIRTKDGREVTIADGSRDSTNGKLIEVGGTYGVIHFTKVKKDKVL